MVIKIDAIYPINLDVSTSEGKEFLVGGIKINWTAYNGLSEINGSTKMDHGLYHDDYMRFINDLALAIEIEIKEKFK